MVCLAFQEIAVTRVLGVVRIVEEAPVLRQDLVLSLVMKK
jgi:hypothetical protein